MNIQKNITMKLSKIKIKSPIFLLSFLLFFLIVIASVIIIPKSSWKNIFGINNFATVFTPGVPGALGGICTNGIINAMAVEGSTLYYGGTFTQVGVCSGVGAPIDIFTGLAIATYPKVMDGIVNSSISDGSGGWYIGGTFTKIGNQTRNRIAHILSDGTLDSSFNPSPNNPVNALVISGSTLYVGGSFTSFGGLARNDLAAYDLANATTTSFKPSANSTVNTLAISNSTLYVGGSFTSFGGLTRNSLAAYDLVNATTTSFNPSPSSVVYVLAISSSTLYAGGTFASFYGFTRSNLAAYDLVNATTTSFNPSPNNAVKALAISSSTLYVGGNFSTFNGLTRNYLAAYDLANATTTSFKPSPDSTVNTLVISGSTLYAGGIFTSFGGLSRSRLAAYDLVNATTTSFNPSANSTVNTLAISNSTLYVGGSFTILSSLTRNYLAAYDLVNDTTTSFNPSANGAVNTLVISSSTLYAGGSFTSFGGLTRTYLAAYNLVNATTTSFKPSTSNSVYALAISSSILYVGGNFTYFGLSSLSRNDIAAYDLVNATTTSFNPGANNIVYALAISSSTLYAGGHFTTFGGPTRNGLAAYDLVNATTTSFNPSNSWVNALVISGSTLYAGGRFTTFGGPTRSRLAAYDLVNATTTSFNPSANSDINTLVISSSTLYAGGNFTSFGGLTRNYLAAYDLANATTTSFNPSPSNTVNALVISSSTLYAGGNFTYFFASTTPGSIISYITSDRKVSLFALLESDIYTTGATLKANITNLGTEILTTRGFNYGLDISYGSTTIENGNFSTGNYNATVADLIPYTTYHYRAYITDRLGTTYTNDSTFFTTLSPVITINSYTLSPTNQDITVTASTTSGTLNATSHTFTSNGSFDFIATDNNNNQTTSIVTITNIDKTSPSVSVTAPTDGATVSSSTVTISADASDDVLVSGVQFKIDTNTSIGLESTIAPYSISWDSDDVSDGPHTLIAVARDSAGNYATSSAINIIVHNNPPIRFNGSPSGTLSLNASNTNISLDTDEVAVCKYSTSIGTDYSNMLPFDSTDGTSHSSSVSGLSNGGSYIYYVKCKDVQNNIDSTEFTISFNIQADMDGPIVTITSPNNNDIVFGNSIVLSADATDNVAVFGVQFKIDNADFGSEYLSSPYETTINSTLLADGYHSITAVARDDSGNYSTSSVITIVVDNMPPSVNVSPDVTASTTFIKHSTTLDDISGILSWLWSQISGPGIITFGTPNGNDTTISVDTDGSYIISLLVTDNAGNFASDNFNLIWTFTLSNAKITAHNYLATVLSTYTENKYTPENWIILNNLKILGDTSIDDALDLAEVSLAQDTAIFDMSGVPVISIVIVTSPHRRITAPIVENPIITEPTQEILILEPTEEIPVEVASTSIATTTEVEEKMESTTTQEVIDTATSSLPSEFCFNKNLFPNTSDIDVKYLQIFLNDHGLNVTEKGNETDYFGSSTEVAIHIFQEHYADDILLPLGLDHEGTGIFGNATRMKVNDILGCKIEIATSTQKEISTTTEEIATTTASTSVPEIQESTSTENLIPETIPSTEEQNSNNSNNTNSNFGGGVQIVSNINDVNKTTVSNISESIQQAYNQTAIIVQNSIAQASVVVNKSIEVAKEIVNSTTGSVVTKSISTVGVVAGAGTAITAVAFANPITFSEVWMIPVKFFGLLMGALGIRKKQRQWGTVYDSVTKRPLDPVYVSLIDLKSKKEVAGSITDIDGRYGFLTLPGKYKIVATKTNYIEPSVKMKGKSFDEVYNDLYFGEEISIAEEGQIISKNIPMDSLSFDWNEFAKTRMNVNKFIKGKDVLWARISSTVFFIGAAVAFITVIFAAVPYNLIVAGLYVTAYILNYVIPKTRKAGKLIEKNTKIPLSFAVVKIFREGEDVPLTKKVADKFGDYYALVPKGKYYIEIDEKKNDGSYKKVFKTEVIDINNGIINMNFVV